MKKQKKSLLINYSLIYSFLTVHLLIDVRTSCLSDIVHLYYAETWADTWIKIHPHDTISFLAHEWDPVEKYPCVFLARKKRFFEQKIAAHASGPDRIISFSKLPPIDTSIPIILHVFDLSDTLYPLYERGWTAHQIYTHGEKKRIKTAKHIIVHAPEIWAHLHELYGIDEERISTVPYLTSERKDIFLQKTFLPQGIQDSYFLTECTPWEEWHPLELLRSYAHYIHDFGGNTKLILLWDLGENLGMISAIIRSLDIIDSVKIVGILSREDRETLYAHAKGWLYTGAYYTRGASIELANTYTLPLFISEITWLEWYPAQYIHPNHIDTLASLLAKEHPNIKIQRIIQNDIIINTYKRIIAW